MAVSLTLRNSATVTETIANNSSSLASGSNTLTHSAFDFSFALSGSTTPVVSSVAEFVATLSGGALTLDLTALTGTNGASVSMSGLKVVVLRVTNLGANDLAIVGGASNGYLVFGTGGKVVVPGGGSVQFFLKAGGPTVGGSTKTLDLTGTTTQTSQWTIIAG